MMNVERIGFSVQQALQDQFALNLKQRGWEFANLSIAPPPLISLHK